jgi:hypothetical protein
MRIPKLLKTACAVALLSVPIRAAAAAPVLSQSEREALLAGEVVARPMRIETDAELCRIPKVPA